MLTSEDKHKILSEFPDIKLSYETIVHKKVYNCDLLLAIPCGIKCFAWFTTFNDKYVCILFELENNKKKEIKNIRIINTCFSKSLCYGTIVYGTLFNHLNSIFFSIEDIFLYKNVDLSRETWVNKFNKIIDVFKNDIKQVAYNNNFVVFGLPILASSHDKLENILTSDNKYKVHCIQYYQSNKTNSYTVLSFDSFVKPEIKETIKETIEVKQPERIPKYIVLEVRPDIQNDIYNVYCHNNISCGIACVPDYKTSVMMNKLFRNIKENGDLDKLEESDDEDEFENPNIDKFVYLEKSFKMKCHYNKKFKKWMPIEVVKNEININSIDEINNFIHNLYETNKKPSYKKK
jgi:hypothetical protein